MTEQTRTNRFTATLVPWLIAAGALLVYLLTLNHWVTLGSLPLLARLENWEWHTPPIQPLYYVITWPLRLLPGNAQFIALNFFSAVCAALTLGLLAKSVRVLPHDRTREQRQRFTDEFSFLAGPLKWAPPIVAVLALAFQMTFWENATAASAEIFDLLVFAYVVRCVLEYRISQEEKWVARMALVYGLAITNNWAMIGFFPLFALALLRIKGLAFFNARFILRATLFGLAGLSFYFVLPIIEALSSTSDFTFWEALRGNLAYQKQFLFSLPFVHIPELRAHLFVMMLTSLLPLLFISIRWPAFQGDVNPAASIITGLMFRILHIVFLGVCLWVLFDPKFSPRALGFGLMPFLTFYFITALCIGYLVGYIMLVFGQSEEKGVSKPSNVTKLFGRALAFIAIAAAIAVPAALIAKNFPIIRGANSRLLLDFATDLNRSLPKQEAVLLSDEPLRIFLVKAVRTRLAETTGHLFLNTRNLENPVYHKFVEKREPVFHETAASTNQTDNVSSVVLISLLEKLQQKKPVYYLHPSFGYYFEKFCPIPHGMTYQLLPYPPNSFFPAPLSEQVISENEKYWDEVKNTRLTGIPKSMQPQSDVARIAGFYSLALNYWGVALQKAQHLDQAKARFQDALAFNPRNVVAQINSAFNEQLRTGDIRPMGKNDEISKRLAEYRSIPDAVNFNGPFDSIEFTTYFGELFAGGGNLRQALQCFNRVLQFSPTDVGAKIGLAKTYLQLHQPEKTLELLQEVRRDIRSQPPNARLDFELLRIEVMTHALKGDIAIAEEILATAALDNPKSDELKGLITAFYLETAVYHISSGRSKEGIAALDALLKRDPKNVDAYFNRAIAHLQLGKLEEAKRDYQKVEQLSSKRLFQIYYGLAEIAQRQNNKAEALRNYKIYLELAPKETDEYKKVQARVKEYQSAAAK